MHNITLEAGPESYEVAITRSIRRIGLGASAGSRYLPFDPAITLSPIDEAMSTTVHEAALILI